MDFNAIKYNKSNKLQVSDGKQLLTKIVTENGARQYDIVLDVGCGSGNITAIISDVLSAKQIYGIDVDHEMIEFAKQNHSKTHINYLQQDFGIHWDRLSPQLRALEGRVDLVFSNHCLHWIQHKTNVANNFYRLLRPGCKLYANIYWIPDLFLDLSAEDKLELEEQVLKIPTRDTQQDIWVKEFTNNGFDINLQQFISNNCVYELQWFTDYILPLCTPMRKQYFVNYERDMPLKEPDIKRRLLNKSRIFKDEISGQTYIDHNYGFFQFVITKQ